MTLKTNSDRAPVVLAAAAHPDDIEFMMAGTLLLLKDAGADIHMWNLANGHCGTANADREEIIRIRGAEVAASAALIGATSHPPLFDDLAIFYDKPSLARVSAVVRSIEPDIILTQAPLDYMEDHQNTCRLLVTAAFSRGMRNYETSPAQAAYDKPVALYHALPHGLHDGLDRAVCSNLFVDTTPVLERKRTMLACHRSQKEWLDISQGMDAYLQEMEKMSLAVGSQSRRFQHAEGWRTHNPLGFAPRGYNPLKQALKGYCHGTTY